MLLFSLIRAFTMIVSYSSAPGMRSVPDGVLKVGPASPMFGRDVVETLDDGEHW